jgi:hypothetical protein
MFTNLYARHELSSSLAKSISTRESDQKLSLSYDCKALGPRGAGVIEETGMSLIKRQTLIWLLATVFLATVSFAGGQQPKKVPRIGFLSASDAARQATPSEGIRLALRELGYIEGQNIAFEYRYAEGKQGRYPEIAAELVRLKVDIIVATGGNVLVRATKNATKTIPIVMAARALGLNIRSWEVRDAKGFEKVFAALNKERPDGLYVTSSPLMNVNGKRIASLALRAGYRQCTATGKL